MDFMKLNRIIITFITLEKKEKEYMNAIGKTEQEN